MPGELGPDRVLVAEQQEVEVVAALPGERGAGHHHRRTRVATHRVDCDPWRLSQRGSSVQPCSRLLLRLGLEDFTSLIVAAALAEIVRQREARRNSGIPDSRVGFSESWLRRMLRLEGEVFLLGTAIVAPVLVQKDRRNCCGERGSVVNGRSGRWPRGLMLSHEGCRL